MSAIDLGIVVAYLLGMLCLGKYLSRANETQEDYFIAGRSMKWLPVAFSIAATTISANGMVGGPGWSYQSGLRAFMLQISIPLVLAVIGCIFLPFLYYIKITSCYEYLQKRFGFKSRMCGAVGFLLSALIQVSSMVYIPSLIISKLTGWDIHIVLVVIVIIATTYTLLGGIKAVIWTDFIQMFIVWGGVVVILICAFRNLDIGIVDTLRAAGEAGKLNPLDFSLDFQLENGVWAALFGGGILWLQYYATDQSQIQRLFAAKSIKDVKRSLAFSGIMMNVLYFGFMILGLIMFSVFNGKDFNDANSIMITFIAEKVPIGFLGIIIAGIFAAAMSSVDSLLNSMTTVFVKDIYEKYTGTKGEVPINVARRFTLAIAILALIFSSFAFMETTSSILATVGSYISYLCGAILALFVLGMFTRKVSDMAATAGFILGVAGTVIIAQKVPMNYLWYNVVGLLLTSLIAYTASFIWPNRVNEEEKFTLRWCVKKIKEANGKDSKKLMDVPGYTDRYFWILIIFWLIQGCVLFFFQYGIVK